MSRLLRAIASNYVVLAVQAVYLVVLTPLIISHEGSRTFGRWALILALVGYLRILDLGLGPTTARFVATGDSGQASAAVSSSLALLLGIGILGLLAATVLGGISLAGADRGQFGLALAVALASRAVQLPLGVAGYALYGFGRIVERNVFASLRSAASLAAVVVTILAGGHLLAFVLAGGCIEIAVCVAQLMFVASTTKGLRISLKALQMSQLWETVRFTSGMLVLSLSSLIIVNSDTVVVGAVLGVGVVAVYTVAMRIIEGSTMLLNQISDVFLPEFSRSHQAGTGSLAREAVRVATCATVCLAFTLVGVFIAFGDRLIRLWVGNGFNGAWIPLLILSGGLIFNAPLRFAVLWSIAADRHRRIGRLATAEAAVNVALTVSFAVPFGIRGVASASLVTFAIWNGWLIPRVVFPELSLSWTQHYLRPVLLASLVALPLSAMLHGALGSMSIPPALLIMASLTWAGALLGALGMGLLRPPDRRKLRQALTHPVASP